MTLLPPGLMQMLQSSKSGMFGLPMQYGPRPNRAFPLPGMLPWGRQPGPGTPFVPPQGGPQAPPAPTPVPLIPGVPLPPKPPPAPSPGGGGPVGGGTPTPEQPYNPPPPSPGQPPDPTMTAPVVHPYGTYLEYARAWNDGWSNPNLAMMRHLGYNGLQSPEQWAAANPPNATYATPYGGGKSEAMQLAPPTMFGPKTMDASPLMASGLFAR